MESLLTDLGSDGREPRRPPRSLVERTTAFDVRDMRRHNLVRPGEMSVRIGPDVVGLTWLDCHFGGSRPLFVCPRCERCCAILYEREHIACRRCHHLAYAIENMAPEIRALTRAFAIREGLGQTEGGIVAPFPRCPKYGHRHVHYRARKRCRAYELRSLMLMLGNAKRAPCPCANG